ncbi:MAG: PTS sugar transporter subunit IIA [Erysipelotrichaceae bacterium]|jgi:PTS system galactitol-specific IIA component
MEDTLILNKNLIELNEPGFNFEETIGHCVDMLIKEGLVENIYKQQVIEREKKSPTGLKFKDITISLAHGDSVGVNKTSMVVARCVNRPEFALMDDPNTFVRVDAVILLAVNNPNNHIHILAKLIEALSKKEVCEIILHSEEEEEVCDVLFKELWKEKGE